VLAVAGWRPPGAIIPLKLDGAEEPVLFVPPQRGEPTMFGALAARLVEHPSFCFDARLEATQASPSVEELARRYVDELRPFSVQPPYSLVGWCTGGAIALEMARILRSDGDAIRALVLINPIGEPKTTLQHYVGEARTAWREGTLIPRATRFLRRRMQQHSPARAASRVLSGAAPAVARDPKRYVARPYGGRIDLVATESFRPTEFWNETARGGLATYRVDLPDGVERATLRPPGVDYLADAVQRALAGNAA
jgi:pimeloyl-ACP methyl ester carboxylesterase